MPEPTLLPQSEHALSRRDVIRLLSGAVAIPLLSGSALAMLHQAHGEMAAAGHGTLRTLNPHQDATITAIAEWIMPQTDTPGAKAVRVNEFIDLLLTDWYSPEERDELLKGLDNADAQCQSIHGARFIDCTRVQQEQMMSYWDEHLTRSREAITPFTGENRYHPKPVDTSFFLAIKRLTLVGFFTSEEGAALVHYEVVPTRHGGCVTIAPAEAAK